MASFGDYVTYDGLIYRVAEVSDDTTPVYTLEPVRRSEEVLAKTITSSQKQAFIIPSGGASLEDISGDDIVVIGSRTATANALVDGYVRVKFDTQDGSDVASQVIEEGGLATDVADPTKTGYTFSNWYYNTKGTGNAVDFTSDVFSDDTTIYAVWVVNTYTVTFDSNDGSTVSAQTINYGDVAVAPTDPSLASFIFDSWYTDDVTFEAEYDFATPVTEDITLYANWLDAVIITFDSNEGSAVTEQLILKGGLATEPNAPTLEEYTFDDWYYDDGTFTEPVDFATDVFEADDTLYANWTLDE